MAVNPAVARALLLCVELRPAQASLPARRPHPWIGPMLGLVGVLALFGCEAVAPSVAPSPTGVRPAIQIDQQWTANGGQWTFTGQVDPAGDPTDVVLEVGPGPANLRRFDSRIPAGQGLLEAGPLTITTTEIPDIADICVRFTATNRSGSSSSSPLCFPHDPPTIAPPGAPTVEMDTRWTTAAGEWTFSARVDPEGLPTDVVMELGAGPASAAAFSIQVPAAQDMTEAGKLTISTRDIPDGEEICVRFTATNAIGAASSEPLCVPRSGATPNP
jgi:hypothetical protein